MDSTLKLCGCEDSSAGTLAPDRPRRSASRTDGGQHRMALSSGGDRGHLGAADAISRSRDGCEADVVNVHWRGAYWLPPLVLDARSACSSSTARPGSANLNPGRAGGAMTMSTEPSAAHRHHSLSVRSTGRAPLAWIAVPPRRCHRSATAPGIVNWHRHTSTVLDAEKLPRLPINGLAVTSHRICGHQGRLIFSPGATCRC